MCYFIIYNMNVGGLSQFSFLKIVLNVAGGKLQVGRLQVAG